MIHYHSLTLLISGKNQNILHLYATQLAQGLLCLNPADEPTISLPKSLRPCDQCVSCVSFKNKHHVDFISFYDEFQTEGSYKVESFRKLKETQGHAGFTGNLRKVIYIPFFEELNTSSSNALLKLFEEPEKNWFFILTTSEEGRILPTILSRCLKLRPADAQNDSKLSDKHVLMLNRFYSDSWQRDPTLYNDFLESFGKDDTVRKPFLQQLREIALNEIKNSPASAQPYLDFIERLFEAERQLNVHVNAKSIALDLCATWGKFKRN